MNAKVQAIQFTDGLLRQCAWVAGFTLALGKLGLRVDRQLLMLLGRELYPTLHHFSPIEAAEYAFDQWPPAACR